MNDYVLLIISIFANLSGATMKKTLTTRYENTALSQQIINAVTSLVSALALLALAGSLKASLFTILLALTFGIVTALQTITFLQALDYGPFSYTSVIISLSMLIPTLSGAMFWNENISPIQIVGILLMVGCFILSVNFSGEQKKASLKWLLLCMVNFILTGAIGIMQKVHQSSAYRDELDVFLIIAFLVSFIYSAANWGILSVKHRGQKKPADSKPSVLGRLPFLLMVGSGVCFAANNKLNLYLSGVMDSALFFPLVNGVGLILTSLAAFILFRERLTRRQWVGLALGIVAVICLCNPFG